MLYYGCTVISSISISYTFSIRCVLVDKQFVHVSLMAMPMFCMLLFLTSQKPAQKNDFQKFTTLLRACVHILVDNISFHPY
jgi:hypothetical protein